MGVEINTRALTVSGKKLFAQEDKKEIGRVYVYFLSNDLHHEPFAFIEDVFVEEDHRGRGVGSELVNRAVEEAKEKGCYKVVMTARTENKGVHTLYSKAGFSEHGKEFRMDLSCFLR